MAKELFDGIYSSHKVVFIERIEKNLHFYLKEKIKSMKRAGQEIIVEIDKHDLDSVLHELKNNVELKVEILNSINCYSSRDDSYMLLSLASMSNNFTMLIKLKIGSFPEKDMNFKLEYYDLINVIIRNYKSAGFYLTNRDLQAKFNDIIIKSQVLDGLDSFDTYILSDYDNIEAAYLDSSISKVPANDIFHNVSFTDLLTVISRLDYHAGIFPELCLCHAIEEIMQIKISKRAQLIRMLISELFRISSHLYYILKMAKILGSELSLSRASIERERVLRMIELITGGRVHPNYIRIGGVKQNLNIDKLLNIKNSIETTLQKVDGLETLLLDNTIITSKLKNTGVVKKEDALNCGLTGPNLRACGVRYDLRKNRNLLLYKDISFLIPIGKYGDCLERLQLRFNEIYQSIKIVKQILDNLPDEPIKKIINLDGIEIPKTEMISSVECPHGVFKIFVEIQDNIVLNLVSVGPSKNGIYCARNILENNNVEDLILILASLDISSGEMLQGQYL